MQTQTKPIVTTAAQSEIHRVKDSSEIFVMAGFSLGALALCFYHNYVAFASLNFFGDHLFFNIFPVICLYRLKAIWNGAELDSGKRTLEFAGGGIVANDPLDYIKPSFLLQLFNRSQISLDDITEISQALSQKTSWEGPSKNKRKTTTRHLIQLVGSFGAVTLSFRSKGKRDELFNLIRQQNRMGTPIFQT